MDHNSIIDKKTFEVYFHAEDYPNAFICDKQLAKTLAILNKKGYKTYASCSGHYDLSFYEWRDVDIKELNAIKNDKHSIIKKIKENSFDYWSEKMTTMIYILFLENYDFISIPSGFEIEHNSGGPKGTCLSYIINFYDNNDERKSRNIIYDEIDKYCNILEKWAENLPNKKGND